MCARLCIYIVIGVSKKQNSISLEEEQRPNFFKNEEFKQRECNGVFSVVVGDLLQRILDVSPKPTFCHEQHLNHAWMVAIFFLSLFPLTIDQTKTKKTSGL